MSGNRPPPDADAEAAVAGAVRHGLAGAAAPPTLLASVDRRARTERRRRRLLVGAAAVLAIALAAGVQRGTGAGSLDASSVLTVADVRPFVPAAEVLSAPQRVEPSVDRRGRLLGGWCSTTPLDGVPTPPEVWSGYWTQPLLSRSAAGSSTFVTQVSEQVLRFDDEAGAVAWASATRGSTTTCDTGGALVGSSLPGSYRVPVVAFLGRPHLAVAVAQAPVAPGAWYIRVVDVRGSVAVDVFALVAAPTARDAGVRTVALLDVALERAPA